MGNIVVLMQAKYRIDRMKTDGAYPLWKKVDDADDDRRRRRRRTTDGSASDKLRWLCQQRS